MKKHPKIQHFSEILDEATTRFEGRKKSPATTIKLRRKQHKTGTRTVFSAVKKPWDFQGFTLISNTSFTVQEGYKKIAKVNHNQDARCQDHGTGRMANSNLIQDFFCKSYTKHRMYQSQKQRKEE